MKIFQNKITFLVAIYNDNYCTNSFISRIVLGMLVILQKYIYLCMLPPRELPKLFKRKSFVLRHTL